MLLSLILVLPTKAAPTWSIQTVDSAGYFGAYTSLVLDSSGNPHISYVTNRALKYAVLAESAWSIQTVDQTGNVGYLTYTSLALDSSNNPHISYRDATNGDLKYASGNPSYTFTPTPTPTPEPTPTSTVTAPPTSTPTRSPSPSPTVIPSPTLEPTQTPTPTPDDNQPGDFTLPIILAAVVVVAVAVGALVYFKKRKRS